MRMPPAADASAKTCGPADWALSGEVRAMLSAVGYAALGCSPDNIARAGAGRGRPAPLSAIRIA